LTNVWLFVFKFSNGHEKLPEVVCLNRWTIAYFKLTIRCGSGFFIKTVVFINERLASMSNIHPIQRIFVLCVA
jgi:hypothetical protein